MDIPNVNGPHGPNVTPNNPSLPQEFDKMIDVYRTLMKNYMDHPSPESEDKMTEFMYKMRSFLTDHKKELFAEEKAQGWHKYSKTMNDGYEGIYNACMIGINTFLNPSTRNSGNTYFVNEQITSLHWMLTHQPGH